VFEVYADGMDLVVFEEFGSGEAALHLSDELQRNALLQDQSYRRRFRKDYEKKWGGRVWQRDFYDATIVDCPDDSLNGRSFGHVAEEHSIHPADLFLDLVVEFGKKLRWHTVIANHRPHILEKIVKNKDSIISFADSGAHIRNMAYYNFPLRLMKIAWEKEQKGQTDFPMHTAVFRLTGELADWFDLDGGYIKEGVRADLSLINPDQFKQRLDAYHEAPMEGFGDISRMVNRNPRIVEKVWINGELAMDGETFHDDLGSERKFGQFLNARQGT
jgi:N-acyl-D-glutamate deacylase